MRPCFPPILHSHLSILVVAVSLLFLPIRLLRKQLRRFDQSKKVLILTKS